MLQLYNLCSSPNIIRVIKSRLSHWRGMWHVWGRREAHTGLAYRGG